MIRLIILGLMLFALPLTVYGQIGNVLDKSTVLVPQVEFDDLVARASFTDSKYISHFPEMPLSFGLYRQIPQSCLVI